MKSCKKLLFSLLLASGAKVFAAACCGGGFAMPTLITGDDRAMFTASYQRAEVVTDVFANGVWQNRDGLDLSQIYKLEAAHIYEDVFQYGISVPVLTRERDGLTGGRSTGLADIAVQVGYEYLPDWDYNPWRPHGVGFLALTLPTGKSVYESGETLGLDSRGRGFWTIGAGTALTKNWTVWDANSTFEIHHAFEKQVNSSQLNGTVKPGNGGSFSLGAGYNIQNLRCGGSAAWAYEDAIGAVGSVNSDGSPQRFATATVMVSYLLPENLAGTLSYSDQTVLGSPTNASLAKTFALSIQKRWTR